MSDNEFTVRPIGVIHTPFRRAEGTPIQPRASAGTEGTVTVLPEYTAGLKDLEGFGRIWLVYWFDRAGPVRLTVRPYMDDTERGLFATRAPSRPNRIGISCVKLLGVDGATLRVADVDMLDGTPLVDIKPYAPQFDCFQEVRTGWLEGRSVRDKRADNRFHSDGGDETR